MEGLKRIGTRDPDGATSCRVSGEPANVLEKKRVTGVYWAFETIHLAPSYLEDREDGHCDNAGKRY